MDIRKIKDTAEKIKINVSKIIIGCENTVELLIAALFCRGHVLLEDVPGTGKTMLTKTLAKSMDCIFSRIQFTPDLLPFDITGISIFDQSKGEFVFKPGPVFTNILLADEINRATPRTQSALLECMQERQVTMDNVTYALDEPFIVLATQNPIDTSGTFPLPEAQLDRFMVKMKMGYPGTDNAVKIIDKYIMDDPLEELKSVVTSAEIVEIQNDIKKVSVSADIRRYMADVVEETRNIDGVMLGVSPRGLLALLIMSQAWAALKGRDYVLPDDVKSVAVPTLAHRIICQSGYGSEAETNEKVIAKALESVAVPTEKISD